MENFSRTIFVLLETTSGENFSKIELRDPQKRDVSALSPKRDISWMLNRYKKLWKHNLTDTNAILMKFTTIMYLHILKTWGVRGRKWKTFQNEAKNQFLSSISTISEYYKKTVTYLMHYLTLHHWSKFQSSLTIIWRV